MHERFPRVAKTANATPEVAAFFDAATSTLTYVVTSPESNQCTIIDPVLDYDEASASVGTASADNVVRYVQENSLSVDYILETHVHADHLSGAHYLRRLLGGLVGIGAEITGVQSTIAEIYSDSSPLARNGSQFDVLLEDEHRLAFGSLDIRVLHVPGHTPGCVAYLIGDALFAGDTLFMPDSGTARCDFPGGDARRLYRSIQRLLGLAIRHASLFATTISLTGGHCSTSRPSKRTETTTSMLTRQCQRRHLSRCGGNATQRWAPPS